jgi:Protein of unknown function (DUF4232)
MPWPGCDVAATLRRMSRMSPHRLLTLTLVLGAAVLVAAASGQARSSMDAPACAAKNLSGKFLLVPNSQGAGNVLYTVQLRNRSSSACFVTGIPGLRLVGKYGKLLPTHVVPIHPGALTAIKVTLKPGGYAAATARFSPDVPGPGEGHPGNCEAVAYKLRISPTGGGSLLGPVSPPTPVCEHGSLFLSTLVAGKRGPLF